MKPFAQVLALCGVPREELTLWIERRWVLPIAANGDYVFNEADLARAQMIAELRHDLAIDDEAIPLVLDLVDQLYAARRRLRQLLGALRDLPEEQREAIRRRIEDGLAAPDGTAPR
jgi:chaperone modulatory protein CbpM